MFLKVAVTCLCVTVLARWAHNVISNRGAYVAHAVLARRVFLRIVLNLWWGQPRVVSFASVTSRTSVWSVWLVPLLSTGEGSTVAGYGLGGGWRCSEACPEDLGESMLVEQSHWSPSGGGGHLFEKT